MKVFEDLRLSDVTELATSADYRDRFLGEYLEMKIRYEKLHKMLIKAEAGKLDFTPTCPIGLLESQARCMGNYLHALEVRAQYENLDLTFLIKSALTDLERAESDCPTVCCSTD